MEKVSASIDEAKVLAGRALKKKVPVNSDDIQFFFDTWESGIISARKNLDEQRIRQAFDKLIEIQKQINHQNDNLTLLLNQKET